MRGRVAQRRGSAGRKCPHSAPTSVLMDIHMPGIVRHRDDRTAEARIARVAGHHGHGLSRPRKDLRRAEGRRVRVSAEALDSRGSAQGHRRRARGRRADERGDRPSRRRGVSPGASRGGQRRDRESFQRETEILRAARARAWRTRKSPTASASAPRPCASICGRIYDKLHVHSRTEAAMKFRDATSGRGPLGMG